MSAAITMKNTNKFNTVQGQMKSIATVANDSDRRTYVGEMAMAIQRAMSANHDRNPNRCAQVNGWLEYGFAVEIARRGHEPIPARPNGNFT